MDEKRLAVMLESTGNYIEKVRAANSSDNKKASFLLALMMLRVAQDLNEGKIDMSVRENAASLGMLVRLASDTVGVTLPELQALFTGLEAAVRDDYERFAAAMNAGKTPGDEETPDIPNVTPEVSDYLASLSLRSKQ